MAGARDSSSPTAPFSVRGGGKLGWVKYTWPLVRLSATKEELVVAAALSETYSFAPSQVVSVEKLPDSLLGSGGIRILHTVKRYPRRIVFWGQPDTLLEGVARAGFVPSGESPHPEHGVAASGFPLRWPLLVPILLAWSLPVAYDFMRHKDRYFLPVGPLSFVAYLAFFMFLLVLLRVRQIQDRLVRPGRDFGEVANGVRLLAQLCGLMLLPLGLIALFNWLRG